MTNPADFAIYDPREGDSPTSFRIPWVVGQGAPSSVVDAAEGSIAVTSTSFDTYRYVFARKAVPEVMEVQFRAQIVSGTPRIVCALRDGLNLVAFLISSSQIEVTDTVGWSIVLLDPFDGTIAHDYLFRKDGSRRWQVFVDGVLAGEVPYDYLAHTEQITHVDFGGANAGVTRFWLVEASLNASIGPAGKVQRWRDTLPISMSRAYGDNPAPEALARTVLGTFETWEQILKEYPDSRTSGAVLHKRMQASGADLPGTGNELATFTGGGPAITIVRDRMRIASSTLGSVTAVQGVWDEIPFRYPHIMVACDLTVRAINYLPVTTVGIGPFLAIYEQYQVGVELAYVPSDETYQINGWKIDPFQTHRIELHMFVGHGALLFIDGRAISFQNWTIVSGGPSAGSNHFALIGRFAGATKQTTIDIENIDIVVDVHDIQRRPGLLQRAGEFNIPVGGCERNDSLEVLVRHRHGLHAARGTDAGIRLELARLTCGLVDVYTDEQPAAWFLCQSWPGVTPVFLAAPGYYKRRIYAIGTGCKTMTAAQLGEWAAYHLLPRSTGAMRYEIALQIETTGAFSAGTASFTTDPKIPLAFHVGDRVEVRDRFGLHPSSCTVSAVSSSSITLSPPPNPSTYIALSVVLLTIGRS